MKRIALLAALGLSLAACRQPAPAQPVEDRAEKEAAEIVNRAAGLPSAPPAAASAEADAKEGVKGDEAPVGGPAKAEPVGH